jgi:hypothetical protein
MKDPYLYLYLIVDPVHKANPTDDRTIHIVNELPALGGEEDLLLDLSDRSLGRGR